MLFIIIGLYLYYIYYIILYYIILYLYYIYYIYYYIILYYIILYYIILYYINENKLKVNWHICIGEGGEEGNERVNEKTYEIAFEIVDYHAEISSYAPYILHPFFSKLLTFILQSFASFPCTCVMYDILFIHSNLLQSYHSPSSASLLSSLPSSLLSRSFSFFSLFIINYYCLLLLFLLFGYSYYSYY